VSFDGAKVQKKIGNTARLGDIFCKLRITIKGKNGRKYVFDLDVSQSIGIFTRKRLRRLSEISTFAAIKEIFFDLF
jgi:hypothetical protein